MSLGSINYVTRVQRCNSFKCLDQQLVDYWWGSIQGLFDSQLLRKTASSMFKSQNVGLSADIDVVFELDYRHRLRDVFLPRKEDPVYPRIENSRTQTFALSSRVRCGYICIIRQMKLHPRCIEGWQSLPWFSCWTRLNFAICFTIYLYIATFDTQYWVRLYVYYSSKSVLWFHSSADLQLRCVWIHRFKTANLFGWMIHASNCRRHAFWSVGTCINTWFWMHKRFNQVIHIHKGHFCNPHLTCPISKYPQNMMRTQSSWRDASLVLANGVILVLSGVPCVFLFKFPCCHSFTTWQVLFHWDADGHLGHWKRRGKSCIEGRSQWGLKV